MSDENRFKRILGTPSFPFEYKYFSVKRVGEEMHEGYPVYRIFTKKDRFELGVLCYYKVWKCYVLNPAENCVFSSGCMRDILNCIERIEAHVRLKSINDRPNKEAVLDGRDNYTIIANNYDCIGFAESQEMAETEAILMHEPNAWIVRTKFVDFSQLNHNGKIQPRKRHV